MKFFKPDYFEDLKQYSEYIMAAADIANEKLNALIESWPVVYTKFYNQHEWSNRLPSKHDTHKARLAFIEPINVVPCEHEKITIAVHALPLCDSCGVTMELVTEWKAKV